MPLDIIFRRQLLQSMKEFFGESIRGFLVIGIAEKDSASERPGFSCGAEILFLKRTEVGRYGLLIGRGSAQQNIRFQIAQVKCMTVFFESTTFPAGNTNRPGLGHRLVNLSIEFEHLLLNATFDHR